MVEIDENSKSIVSDIKEQTGVTYNMDANTVSFSGSGNSTDHFKSLFEYLIENGFISENDLPFSAIHATTRFILNDEPSHKDRDMIRPVEIKEGIYLETNHDTESKIRYSKKAIEDFILRQ